jgi:alkylation response protein AidB-like acyl-CoA dehydrogenase
MFVHFPISRKAATWVDLDLSPDQELFLETTRKFLSARWPTTAVRQLIGDPVGFDRELFAEGAELGWTSMLVPEELGGGTISENGVCDLAIIAEALGASLFAGPVLPTNVVAFALARAGSDELTKEHLPSLASGSEIAAWAVAEENDRWAAESGALQVAARDGIYRLTGVKTPVQDAHVADYVLVGARTASGVTQFLVSTDAPGMHIEVMHGLDLTRRFCRVHFDAVEVAPSAVVGPIGRADHELELQLAFAVALQCAETVGATDRMYETTLEYVKNRRAFGRPLGSYQALKHRLADMLLWLESAKALTDAAINAIQFDIDALDAASMAKAYIGERCPVIVRECLQMHGGIGFTWEHDLHLFMRRVESNAAIYGSCDYHRDRLAPTVGFSAAREDL